MVRYQCWTMAAHSTHPLGRKVSVVELPLPCCTPAANLIKTQQRCLQICRWSARCGRGVTNALSNKVEVTVYRDGSEYSCVFLRRGEDKLRRVGSCPKISTGTMVRAWPNPKYFDVPMSSCHSLSAPCAPRRAIARCQRHLHYEKTGHTQLVLPDGLRGYLTEALMTKTGCADFCTGKICTSRRWRQRLFRRRRRGWVSCGQVDGLVMRESYVNLIPH